MPVANPTVSLEDTYGLDYTKMVNGSGDPYTIGDEFTVGTDAARVLAARALFPWWVGYCNGTGPGGITRTPTAGAPLWTDAQILACSFAVAAHNDAIWATGAGINQDWYYGAPPLSRANIVWPHGAYAINYPLIGHYGLIQGQGQGNYAPDLADPPSEVTAGTRLMLWHEEWLDIPVGDFGPKRYLIQSLNWPCWVGGTMYAGVLGATGGGADVVLAVYMEGFMVERMRFDGRKAYAPEAQDGGETFVTDYEDAGMALWRTGSVSQGGLTHADNFNNAAYQFASAVPGVMVNARGFFCNQSAVWLRGDGTLTITGFECDDCPTTFQLGGFEDPLNPGDYLLTPGGTLTVNGVKIETGTSGDPTKYKGTCLLDAVGWTVANINGVGYAGTNSFPEMLCRVEPYPTGFTSTESYVNVTGLKVFGFVRTLMHHADSTGQSKKWFLDKGEYTVKYNSTIHQFTYNSADGGTLTVDSGAAPAGIEVPYVNRQNWLASPRVQSWDDTVDPGLPLYSNPLS